MKADIYTIAGIDSKHPSTMRRWASNSTFCPNIDKGICSTLYGKKDFMTEEEISAAFETKKKPVEEVIKKKAGGAGFVDVPPSNSDSDDDKPKPAKKAKK